MSCANHGLALRLSMSSLVFTRFPIVLGGPERYAHFPGPAITYGDLLRVWPN